MLATAGAYAFNAAHCVAYGMLAYWCMWIKRHHPAAFYVSSLVKCGVDVKGRKRRDQLLRDAMKKGLRIGRIRLNVSGETWTADPDDPHVILPGYKQIEGIGDKTAEAILLERERVGRFADWPDLLQIKGIGPATLNSIMDFWENEDPFDLNLLSETLDKVRKALAEGVIEQDEFWQYQRLPAPTHTAAEVPYDRTERDVEVVWLGVVRERNLKDLFELHHSRTGEVLDPKDAKDSHLQEWVVFTCEDETDQLVVTIDRWRYPQMKERAWSIEPNKDLILVRGLKRRFQARRAVYVTNFWVLDTSEEENDNA